MEEPNNIFKFRFYDNDVTPDSFSLKELGNLLIHIEDSLKAIVDNDYPEISVDDINLSLINIENKSESLYINTLDSPVQTINALRYFSESIQNESYINLPPKAYDGFKFVYQLVKDKKCNAEILYKEEKLCTISYNITLIKPESAIVKIDKVLYGELQKVGGDNKSKAWIELANKNKVSFDITKEQAIQLGQYIYKTIAIKGQAKWNVQLDFITEFKLYSILEFNYGNISNAFKELRNATSGVWNKFESNEDISQYLDRN